MIIGPASHTSVLSHISGNPHAVLSKEEAFIQCPAKETKSEGLAARLHAAAPSSLHPGVGLTGNIYIEDFSLRKERVPVAFPDTNQTQASTGTEVMYTNLTLPDYWVLPVSSDSFLF